MNFPRAVVLLSGGLDSTTVLAIARAEGLECHSLTVDYGQRHRIELEAVDPEGQPVTFHKRAGEPGVIEGSVARAPGTPVVVLTAHGDQLVRERRTPLAEVREQNHRYNAWIERRAGELADRHPELADSFRAYVEKERQECEILERLVECATWLLRGPR